MSFSLKAKSLAKNKKQKPKNHVTKKPNFYSPENHPAYEANASPLRPTGAHMPQPAHSDGRQGIAAFKIHCFALRGRVPSAEGTATQSQCWESLKGTKKCDPKRPKRLFPAAVESASGLEFLVISNVTWLRLLGMVKHSHMPTKGRAQLGKRVLLAGS